MWIVHISFNSVHWKKEKESEGGRSKHFCKSFKREKKKKRKKEKEKYMPILFKFYSCLFITNNSFVIMNAKKL